MRKPFKDWTLENFVGLAMLATVILLVVSGLTAICFVCWASVLSLIHISEPTRPY